MLSSTDPDFNSNEEKAFNALTFILPIIKRYGFKWVITGGFASYVHGVKRNISDIDIDLFTEKDNQDFKDFVKEIEKYSEGGLEHNVDEYYDNYSIDLNIEGQIVDICPVENIKVFSKEKREYIKLPFYNKDFKPVIKKFKGIDLQLLPIEMIIQNKEITQREIDLLDISKLKKLLKDS